MSVESALSRIGALQQALADPASLLAAATGGTAAPASPVRGPRRGHRSARSFAEPLQQASAGYPRPPGACDRERGDPDGRGDERLRAHLRHSRHAVCRRDVPPLLGLSALPGAPGAGGGAGSRVVAIAESQIGQAEQPPGSNESPAIAEYRGATAGAAPGEPWCAYFASWAARQAGVPLGPNGEGLGSVSQIWSWAQSSGRAIPNGPGVTPQPGDLIVFGGEHVGIVRDVLPDGRIETIEGNYSDKVSQNVRAPGEATGYVRLG